jgi:hypothetical protein
MKAGNFRDAQKAFILKQGADGTPVAGICGKRGSARRPASIGRRRMPGCFRPKKILVDPALDREMVICERLGVERMRELTRSCERLPKAITSHPGRMREPGRGMCHEGARPIRKARGAIGFDCSTVHGQSRRAKIDMAGAAGASTAAFSDDPRDPGIARGLHHGAALALNGPLGAITQDEGETGQDFPPLVMAPQD